MILPFVSRATHAAEVARLRDLALHEHENAQSLRMENLEWAAKYHELVTRLHPFDDGKAPIGPPPEKKPPSPIAKVIREQASEAGTLDHALASHLRKYAKSLQEEGLSEDEIVGKLVEWQTSETQTEESFT